MSDQKKERPQERFDRLNSRRYSLKVMVHTEKDIIERLEEKENVSGYIKALIRSDMEGKEMTYDLFVGIHSAYRPGEPGKRGPEGLRTYCGVAGVSTLSSRAEFDGVGRNIPPEEGKIVIENEVGGLGYPPHRKQVTIKLPDGIHSGRFSFSGVTMYGLYSELKAKDGMGNCVGVWCRKSVVVDAVENWEKAIDEAIASGFVLYVPQADGSRVEIPVETVCVSGMLL